LILAALPSLVYAVLVISLVKMSHHAISDALAPLTHT
jgi:hypothetical protein